MTALDKTAVVDDWDDLFGSPLEETPAKEPPKPQLVTEEGADTEWSMEAPVEEEEPPEEEEPSEEEEPPEEDLSEESEGMKETEGTEEGEGPHKTAQRSWEQDVTLFRSLLENETGTLWTQAETAYAIVGLYGRTAPKKLAGEVGVSASYVRMLVATFKAFPEDEDRAKDFSFSHHRIAARTEDPKRWLNLAIENQWSVRDLDARIKESKDRFSEQELAKRAESALINAVTKYNERFSSHTQRRAILSWAATLSDGLEE